MPLSTAKVISAFFDEVVETWDANNVMSHQVDVINFPSSLQQNSVNVVWRQVEQQTPVKNGWDMTDEFGDVLELSYPSTLGEPTNDAFQLRADDFRDDRFMKRRAQQAVNKLSAEQNKRIAALVVDTGSLAYVSASGDYTHLAKAETIMDSLELAGMDQRSFFLKPVNHEAIAADLAARGTLSGKPEGAYNKSMIGKDIAGFDVFRANVIPTLAENAATITTDAALGVVPSGFITNSDGTDVPVDYREATLVVVSTTGCKRGDKFTIPGVFEVSTANKINTGRLRSFTIVTVIDATDLKIFPAPIAWDQRPTSDGGDDTLTAEQAAYANVSTEIPTATVITFLNDDTNAIWQPDVFWTNDSIELVAGDAPFEFMGEMDGFKVIKETLDGGTTLYMMWQGDIGTATLKARCFAWYGIVNKKPESNGIALPTF